ncbi:MAG: type II secretion system F family protein [Actinomycetota bacterium]|nr:type II secretion system F family protein [Actinomycetota bacterium]
MTTLLVALSAAGLTIAVLALPPFAGSRLFERVEPYLSGLRGKPSSLLARPRRSQGPLSQRLTAVVSSQLPGSRTVLERRMEAAGREPDTERFRIEQLFWGGTVLLAGWLCAGAASAAGAVMDLRVLPFLSALMFAFGFLGWDWLLSRAVERRREVLEEELPTAIDLMTLALMSGESVPAAFRRVALVLGSGIGAELSRVIAEMRAGASVTEGIESLRQRIPGPATARFVDALVTGIERGAPLADVLRAQAEDARDARRRALLEAGGKREVLMLLPVVFLIMPVVVVYTLYPGLVSLDLLAP